MLGFSDIFVGEAVVLFLLIPVLLRPLFTKRKRSDSIVMLAPLSFILSLLLISIYGISWELIITGGVSFIVLFTNIRALQRFYSRLYVDYYSLTFRIAAVTETLLVLCTLILLFVFRPAAVLHKPEKQTLSPSFSTRGFREKRNLFEPVNAVIYRYGLTETDKTAVVFLPDIYTTAEDSALRLEAAAQKGIPVLTGDFYEQTSGTLFNAAAAGRYTKRFVLHRLLESETAGSPDIKAFLLAQKKREAEALLITAGNYASSIILVSEGDTLPIAHNLQTKYSGFVRGVFDAASVPVSNSAYIRKTADMLFTAPFDAFFIFYGRQAKAGQHDSGAASAHIGAALYDFFSLRKKEAAHSNHLLFADTLQSYMESL